MIDRKPIFSKKPSISLRNAVDAKHRKSYTVQSRNAFIDSAIWNRVANLFKTSNNKTMITKLQINLEIGRHKSYTGVKKNVPGTTL